ncbi:hypothetical protein F5890DRAFT_1499706 [Lentinula detonsa]|uniref:Uncharacterized protein n=1 Tax=Lentinula detonsa TaxID=2804962 RepID=A0AA38Q496_9AGAR|nr:hypothetical protein F5890DRAFT_1499706 [Lentinula detonsa]
MMLVHGPTLVILSLLLGLLSTTADAAPLDGCITPIVPRALHSHLQVRSQGSDNPPPPSPPPHTNGHTNGHIHGPTRVHTNNRNAPQYSVWFSQDKPVFIAPDAIEDQIFDGISHLERLNGVDIAISLLESYPESARGFRYQKVGDNQVHYVDFAPT